MVYGGLASNLMGFDVGAVSTDSSAVHGVLHTLHQDTHEGDWLRVMDSSVRCGSTDSSWSSGTSLRFTLF